MNESMKIAHGVVLDMDDLVCDTSVACGELLWKNYPLSTYENAVQALEKWATVDQVPEWQTHECSDVIFKALNDPHFLADIRPIDAAVVGAKKIAEKFPIRFYLTSRLPVTQSVSQEWLKINNFPSAPVICREPHVVAKDWKVHYLEENFPDVLALIDNELYVTDPVTYSGQLLELIRFKTLTPSHPRKKTCHNWSEVLEYLEHKR